MTLSLREQFSNHLFFKRYSPKTHEAYLGAVNGLALHYMKSPDQISDCDIQSYLTSLLKEKKLAWSTCNVIFSGLVCFYSHFLKRPETGYRIPPRPRIKKIPMILSCEEVENLFGSLSNLKHYALLLTIYSAGLRVSEAVNLKPIHIESDPSRMLIRVEQGKGRRDRYTILSNRLVTVLRDYWLKYQPAEWVFFGQERSKPMPIATAQRIYYNAKKRSGTTKGRGIHTLRHCFASHLMWKGTDIPTIKKLLGHSSIKTTYTYLHVTQAQIDKVVSPLELLDIQGGRR